MNTNVKRVSSGKDPSSIVYFNSVVFILGQKGTFESLQFWRSFFQENCLFEKKQSYVRSTIKDIESEGGIFRQLRKQYNEVVPHFSIRLIHHK